MPNRNYYLIILIFILLNGLYRSHDLINQECSINENRNDKIKQTELIIRGRILNIADESAVTLVLKVMKGYEIIGTVKKASQENDYHLILINNINKMAHCNVIVKPNDDFILFLKSTGQANIFQIEYFDRFADGTLEKDIIKAINGGFSRHVQNDDPCSTMECKFGALCKKWPGKQVKAVCQCPNIDCTNDRKGESVCGSDGQIYKSTCDMRMKQCFKQKVISPVSMHICDSSYVDTNLPDTKNNVQPQQPDAVPPYNKDIQHDYMMPPEKNVKSHSNNNWCSGQQCPPYATCITYPYPHCRCSTDQCDSNSPEICGTDEITYTNICEMKKVSCKANRLINEQHKGVCDMCKFVECPFNGLCRMSPDGTHTLCECDKAENVCLTNHQELCVSDGKTYSSECYVKIAECNQRTKLIVLHKGPCTPPPQQQQQQQQMQQTTTTISPGNKIPDIGQEDVCGIKRCLHGAECVRETMVIKEKAGGDVERRRTISKCSCDHITCAGEWTDPLCANDGNTYDNQCLIRKEECKKQREIRVLYRGECQQNPCNRVKCTGPHQYCRVDVNGVGNCVCPDKCPDIVDPVCGSDGQSYDSICHLTRFSCLNSKNIWALHNGICSEEPRCREQGYTCSTHQICRSDLRQTRCDCPTCPETGVGEHVCGSDGKTYRSQCHFRNLMCIRNTHDVIMTHLGACDACRQKKCSFYAICKMNRFGEPQCICPTDCIYVQNPVCGSDGRTYDNECYLKVKSCAENKPIKIVARGACKKCATDCPFGQVCQNGECKCIEKCDSIENRVCGTDGKYYKNECELTRYACQQKKTIHVDLTGNSCYNRQYISDQTNQQQYPSADNNQWNSGNKPVPDAVNCHCDPIGSINSVCSQSTGQCACKTGVSGKRCEQCNTGYWGFSSNGCTSCSCNKYGSESLQCDLNTGECKCKDNAKGRYCSVCPLGYEMSNSGCQATNQNQENIDKEELGFSADSFATTYWTGNADRYIRINMTFVPYTDSGILIYVSDPSKSNDFLSIVMRDRYIEFRMDLGSGVLLITSQSQLNLRKAHNLIAERFDIYARLIVDDGSSVHGSAPKNLRSLDTGSVFTIGQPHVLPNNGQEKSGGVTDSFTGCLKSLSIKTETELTNYLMKEKSSWVLASSNVKPNCPAPPPQQVIKQTNEDEVERDEDGNGNGNGVGPRNNNVCGSNKQPCKNDGVCQSMISGVYRCLCKPGFQGHMCEEAVSPIWKFFNSSFTIIPTRTFHLQRRLKLEIQFLPTSGQGLIAFISDGNINNPAFISVSLANNRAFVICRTPIGVTELQSHEKIKIGKWNQIVVLKAAKYIYLNLNESPNPRKERLLPKNLMGIREDIKKKLTQFRITNQPLFIGGVDDTVQQKFQSVVKLRPNFEGAIQKIVINGEAVHFYKLSRSIFYSQITQWQGPPCGPLYNPCRPGDPRKSYCVPDMEQSQCYCPPEQEHLCYSSDTMQQDNPIVNNYYRKFTGQSIVKYTSSKYKRIKKSIKNNIRFTFKTSSNDGMILIMKKKWSARKDFLVVAIRNSVIELSLNLGGPKGIIRITSNRKISDDKWHTVQVIRNKRNVVLLVDNRLFPSQMLPDPVHYTLQTDGWIWLGGPKKSVGGFPWEYNTNFMGCVSEMYVDEVAYNLISDARKNIGPILKC